MYRAWCIIVVLLWYPSTASTQPLARYETLVREYAPVFVHELGAQPRYDRMTRFDFDNNQSGYDNVANATRFPLPATVYGDVIAETADSVFIFYGVFHIRDYDTPVREFFFSSASHDNDFEGAMVVVNTFDGTIRAIETWFHSIFLQFAPTDQTSGNQSIDGKIHVEDLTHPILYVQSRGHGVRSFQKMDEPRLASPHQFYRLGDVGRDLQDYDGPFVTYTLLSLEHFCANAGGPFDAGAMFDVPEDYGLGQVPLGKYFSGNFVGDSSWARAKPPWSWNDKFDSLRPGSWFFHPAHVFQQHFGLPLSTAYTYNLGVQKILFSSVDALDTWVVGKSDEQFFEDIEHGFLYKPQKWVRGWLYRVTEWLFYYLG